MSATVPPAAESAAPLTDERIVPALIDRYLITMTCDLVPIFPSLVAVMVTVPRSMPVRTPVTLSMVATAGFDVSSG